MFNNPGGMAPLIWLPLRSNTEILLRLLKLGGMFDDILLFCNCKFVRLVRAPAPRDSLQLNGISSSLFAP